MNRSAEGAALLRTWVPPRAHGVALVLHGGAERSPRRVKAWDLAVLRLRPVAWSIARQVRGVAVYRLQFSLYGWNHDGEAARRDARWAVAELRRRHPGVPVVLVGHSMGARVSAQVADEPAVTGAVLLTPWTPDRDPVAPLRDRTVLVAQGGRDTTCPEPQNRVFFERAAAAGATVERVLFPGLEHTMLRRFWVWHDFAADGVRRLV